jgi:hypothetical protein
MHYTTKWLTKCRKIFHTFAALDKLIFQRRRMKKAGLLIVKEARARVAERRDLSRVQ